MTQQQPTCFGIDGGGLRDDLTVVSDQHGRVHTIALLTSIERTMLRTGKSEADVVAEGRARLDAILDEIAAHDSAEFNAAVRLGIVAPTDPRTANHSHLDRPEPSPSDRDTLDRPSCLARSFRGRSPRSSRIASRSRFRSVLVKAASFVLRGWRRNLTVAGRGAVASLSPEGRDQ